MRSSRWPPMLALPLLLPLVAGGMCVEEPTGLDVTVAVTPQRVANVVQGPIALGFFDQGESTNVFDFERHIRAKVEPKSVAVFDTIERMTTAYPPEAFDTALTYGDGEGSFENAWLLRGRCLTPGEATVTVIAHYRQDSTSIRTERATAEVRCVLGGPIEIVREAIFADLVVARLKASQWDLTPDRGVVANVADRDDATTGNYTAAGSCQIYGAVDDFTDTERDASIHFVTETQDAQSAWTAGHHEITGLVAGAAFGEDGTGTATVQVDTDSEELPLVVSPTTPTPVALGAGAVSEGLTLPTLSVAAGTLPAEGEGMVHVVVAGKDAAGKEAGYVCRFPPEQITDATVWLLPEEVLAANPPAFTVERALVGYLSSAASTVWPGLAVESGTYTSFDPAEVGLSGVDKKSLGVYSFTLPSWSPWTPDADPNLGGDVAVAVDTDDTDDTVDTDETDDGTGGGTEYGPLSGRVWGLVGNVDGVPLCTTKTSPPSFYLANGTDCGGGLLPVVMFLYDKGSQDVSLRAENPQGVAPWRITSTTEGTVEAGTGDRPQDKVVGLALDQETTVVLDPSLTIRFTLSDPGAGGAITVAVASILGP